jgi:hypothetical protein
MGDDVMKRLKIRRRSIIAVSLLGFLLLGQGFLLTQEAGSRRPVPKGIWIELNKDFYEALKGESTDGSKVYSNNPSEDYLRQIAVSSRFMVETNLQMLKQQEEMIQMLQTLLEGKASGKR